MPVPASGDFSIAKIRGEVSGSGKLPKLRLKAPKALPDNVLALATAKQRKGEGKFSADLVLFDSDAVGRVARAASGGNVPFVVDPPPGGNVSFTVATAPDVFATPPKSHRACDNHPPGFRKIDVLGGAATLPFPRPKEGFRVAENGCAGKPAFNVSLSDLSWKHHTPSADETTVCATVAITQPLLNAATVHGEMQPPDVIGHPNFSDSVTGADGTVRIGWVTTKPGVKNLIAFVTGWGQRVDQTGSLNVPDSEENGPAPCG